MELSVGEMVTVGVCISSAVTAVITNLNTTRFLEKKIEQLEKKQDKYNNVIERTFRNEESTKSAHNRIDDSEKERREDNRILTSKMDQILEN